MTLRRAVALGGAGALLAACATVPTGPVDPGSPSPSGATGVPTLSGSGTLASTPGTSVPSTETVPGAPAELPRGGRTLFPRYRLFGYSGSPGSSAFGRLGVGDLDARVAEMERRGTAYAAGREVLPVLELITVVAQARPGADGDYNSQVSAATIQRYLGAARRHRALLLLDIQPGRADFMSLVKALTPWLEQPDVGLALDPEWAVAKDQVPGRVYGSTTGRELDAVAAYLDRLVTEHDLPQKVMVFHQVAASVVKDQAAIRERPGVAVIKSVDGIGSRAQKTETWTKLTRALPSSVHSGFKLFFDEDARHGPLMTPAQVLALRPQPEYVLYE